MNRIGHSSPTFCHDGIAATAQRISDDGFDAWEIVGEGGHDPWLHRKTFREVLASLDLEIQLHAPLSDANLGSLVPDFWALSLKTMDRAIRGAAAIGAAKVNIHPGNHTPLSRGQYPRLHAATRKALRTLDQAGREHGVQLMLENMPTGWAFETDSLEKLEDLVEGTDFAFCFDIGHAHVAKKLDEFVGAAKRVQSVHVHDNKGDFDAHLTLDEGNLPWRDVLSRMVKKGYKGAFVIESRTHESGVASRRLLKSALD